MEIQQSKNIITGDVNTNGGNFHVGDNFYKSAEYQDFQKQISRLQRLIELTDDMRERLEYSKELNELQNQLEAFKRDIIQLAETFQKIDIDTERLRLAKQHFDNGEYKAARAVLDAEQMTGELDALLAEKERLSEKTTQNTADLKDKANEFLILARLTALDFSLRDRFERTKEYFEKSIEAHRNPDNLFAYGFFLQSHKQYSTVQRYYEEALSLLKNQKNESPKNLSKIGLILNGIGSLNHVKNNFEYAELIFEEALKIYYDLHNIGDDSFLVELGMVMNNLGCCMQHTEESLSKSEKIFKKALRIRKNLARSDDSCLFDVGMTLNNLGVLYRSRNEFDKSETVLIEALNIRRQLTKINPNVYMPDVGMTLGNIAVLYCKKEEISKARHAFKESLSIYRKLSITNPYTYLPYLGSALHNLGNFNYENYNLKDAEIELKEALEIRKNLATNIPSVYLSDVSTTLNNLGNLYRDKKKFDIAETYYCEALIILKEFVDVKPLSLAVIMINMSMFYCYDYPQKEESVSLAFRVLKITMKFQHIPIMMQYRGAAIQVLQKWNVDVESVFAKNSANSNNP